MEVDVVADICPIEIYFLGGSVTVATLLVGLGCCGVTGVSADKSNLKRKLRTTLTEWAPESGQ